MAIVRVRAREGIHVRDRALGTLCLLGGRLHERNARQSRFIESAEPALRPGRCPEWIHEIAFEDFASTGGSKTVRTLRAGEDASTKSVARKLSAQSASLNRSLSCTFRGVR